MSAPPVLAAEHSRLWTAGGKRGPAQEKDRALRHARSPHRRADRLPQRGADGGKVGTELCTNTVHGRDDSNRNAGCDQAVFDRSDTGFVLQELQNKRLHGGLTSVLPSGT